MSHRVASLARVLACASLLAGVAAGQSWPQFRGLDGDATAHAPDLPVTFTLDDARWRAELPGPGSSSPVVAGGRVFVTSVVEGKGVRVVSCLDAADGAVIWAREEAFEPYPHHAQNDLASSSPAADGERVYVVWPDGGRLVALALDRAGELAWRTELGAHVQRYGGGASPVLVDGVLVVANDDESDAPFLAGLDAATGEVRWRRPRESDKGAFATPVVHRDRDGRAHVIFSSTAHGLTSLDPATGELRWEQSGLFSERCVASPVVIGQLVFATSGGGGGGKESAAVRIPENGETPRLVHRPRRSLPYVPSPAAAGNRLFLFADGGVVSCLKAGSGGKVWSERIDGEFFGSPIVVDGRLYAMTKEGVLIVLAAADEFSELARVDLGEPANATPAVADGVLYLRTARHVTAFGARRGE